MEPGKKIVYYPHPALRHPAKPLAAIDAEVRKSAGRMLELMYEHKGLGLAAPQVALPVQLLVMNFEGEPEKKDLEVVAINPVVLDRKGTQEGSEGCLSFPDLYQKVRRAKTVTVQFYDLSGNLCQMTCSELPARLWQHEIDHLHGRLFIDVMGPMGRLASKSMLKEFERDYRAAQKKGEIESDEQIREQLKDWTSNGHSPPPIL
ncbi:MAG TPA: peptide deformylase [Gemmataceae bacterium]|nr:peptide deformylase [Gemmataceae bacterium]